jgi:hypothetical protein
VLAAARHGLDLDRQLADLEEVIASMPFALVLRLGSDARQLGLRAAELAPADAAVPKPEDLVRLARSYVAHGQQAEALYNLALGYRVALLRLKQRAAPPEQVLAALVETIIELDRLLARRAATAALRFELMLDLLESLRA